MPEPDAPGMIRRIAALPQAELHSISTHLPAADEDADYTREELARFARLVGDVRADLPSATKIHALLSAGIFAFAGTPYDIVRAGLMLYGISPLPSFQAELRPVMSLKSRLVLIRDLPAGASISYGRTFITPRPMRVGTVGAGYADGYPRACSNRGAHLLVAGKRCPVLGRITMDLLMVDLTETPEAAVGDEVVLFGEQGNTTILASEVAEWAGTIPWEIFTGIGSRVRRVYLS